MDSLNVQAQPGWQSHTGGNIGGDPAKIYTMDQGNPPAAVFFIKGCTKQGGYADAEWYNKFPIPPRAVALIFSYDIMLDASSLTDCQADEMDVILTDADDLNYNGSMQLDYAKGGELQIANRSGSWVSTGFTPGKYAPNVVHHVQVFYAFDFAGKTISTTHIVIDDQIYPVPSSLQRLPATHSGWTDSLMAMVQIQQDLNARAGQYYKTVNHANLNWTLPPATARSFITP
jgi:hypothetical protein